MTDPTLGSPFTGSTKVTCREAAWLVNAGAVDKAWFRPDGFVDHKDADLDVAFVWYKEDYNYAMPEENNTEPQGA